MSNKTPHDILQQTFDHLDEVVAQKNSGKSEETKSESNPADAKRNGDAEKSGEKEAEKHPPG